MGVDFTSAPASQKAIVCASGTFDGAGELAILEVERLTGFAAFEALLERPGPWVAGLDFPFGLPYALVKAWGLPEAWAEYVRELEGWGRAGFESRIRAYQAARPKGAKEHLRLTDALARARSPMKLANPPVGKMFFEGASRLRRSPVSIRPCRPRAETRLCLEAYPALIARRFAGRYKGAGRAGRGEGEELARAVVLKGIQSAAMTPVLGFRLRIPAKLAEMARADAEGDVLDAILSAAQAAWAHGRRGQGYGIPHPRRSVVRSEGWIVDPYLTGAQG